MKNFVKNNFFKNLVSNADTSIGLEKVLSKNSYAFDDTKVEEFIISYGRYEDQTVMKIIIKFFTNVKNGKEEVEIRIFKALSYETILDKKTSNKKIIQELRQICLEPTKEIQGVVNINRDLYRNIYSKQITYLDGKIEFISLDLNNLNLTIKINDVDSESALFI